MHRVELKVSVSLERADSLAMVPNAPCGVESNLSVFSLKDSFTFLMHRVELKAFSGA